MKILLLGKDGQVGWELQRSLAPLGELIAAGRNSGSAFDLARTDDLAAAIRGLAPDVIVNAAAYTAVDRAEEQQDLAQVINADAPRIVAAVAAELGSMFVHFSTDYVFNGEGHAPWHEDAPASPLNVYGRTKLAGEQAVRASGCRHLIVRTAWVYSCRRQNFLRTMLRLAVERDRLSVVADQHGTPTGAELIADVTAQMLRQSQSQPRCDGTYHLTAAGETTWHGFATHAIETARALGLPLRVARDAVLPIASADYPTPAQRPKNSRLDTSRLQHAFSLVLPDWRAGVERAVNELLAQAQTH